MTGRVGCAVYRLDRGLPVPATVAGPGDELLLVVRVGPRRTATELTIELYRGEELRDRRRQALPAGAATQTVVLRLHRGEGAGASSRLMCRALLDGRPVAQRTVLLVAGADAQGRLAAGSAGVPPSAATRLACEQALRRLLDGPGQPSGAKTGPPDGVLQMTGASPASRYHVTVNRERRES